MLSAQTLRWILGVSFLGLAVWMLIPDKLDDNTPQLPPRFGVFFTTMVVFFSAEMGDKTQIATVMLAARFNDYFSVVAGIALGMMLANGPVEWFGEKMTRLVPLRAVRLVSVLFFAALGVDALMFNPG